LRLSLVRSYTAKYSEKLNNDMIVEINLYGPMAENYSDPL